MGAGGLNLNSSSLSAFTRSVTFADVCFCCGPQFRHLQNSSSNVGRGGGASSTKELEGIITFLPCVKKQRLARLEEAFA